MKVIIPEEEMKSGTKKLNYAERRKARMELSKDAKRKISKKEFDMWLLTQRLKNGEATADDVRAMASANVSHYDNPDLFPDGTEVKLNFDSIMKRPKSDLTEEFINWVESNKDKEFHLCREENHQSLVCLKEDVRKAKIDGKTVTAPKWMFDLFSDLLVKNKSVEYVEPAEIEGSYGDFVDLSKEKI